MSFLWFAWIFLNFLRSFKFFCVIIFKKNNEVTTEHQKLPTICKSSTPSFFFLPKGKKHWPNSEALCRRYHSHLYIWDILVNRILSLQNISVHIILSPRDMSINIIISQRDIFQKCVLYECCPENFQPAASGNRSPSDWKENFINNVWTYLVEKEISPRWCILFLIPKKKYLTDPV